MSTEEYYAVLDNQRRVIGKAPWREVHEKGLLHEVVAVFIFRDKSCRELLMQKRSIFMTQDPGKWNHSAGGHVIYGQTTEDAIQRETQEELFDRATFPNIDFEKITSFFQKDKPGNRELLTLFRVIYSGPFYPDKKELDAPLKWVSTSFLHKDIQKHPNLYTVSFIHSFHEYIKSLY